MSGFAIPFVEDVELSPNTKDMLEFTPAGTAPPSESFLQSTMKKRVKKPKLTEREKMKEYNKLRQLHHFYPQESGRYSPITIGLKEGRVVQKARARSPLFPKGIPAEQTEKDLLKWTKEGTSPFKKLDPNKLTPAQKKILKSPKKKGLQPHELAQPQPTPLTPQQQMWKRLNERKLKAKADADEVKAIIDHPIQGGRKTRKKSRRFRNNLRKNKISRKYIMLKQCGGGKAKMGAKSKPYSSKRKAMKSRRRVCYYKKKGRTLKLKKKKKSRGRKKSRRRR